MEQTVFGKELSTLQLIYSQIRMSAAFLAEKIQMQLNNNNNNQGNFLYFKTMIYKFEHTNRPYLRFQMVKMVVCNMIPILFRLIT